MNTDIEQGQDGDDIKDNRKYIDKAFGRIETQIKLRREKLNVNLERFGQDSTKYKLNVHTATTANVNKETTVKTKEDGTELTSIELLLSHLDEYDISTRTINAIIHFLKQEHYGTHLIKDDIIELSDINQQHSNILNLVGNGEQKCCRFI